MLCAFRNLYAAHGLSTKVADQLLQNAHFNEKGDEITQLHLVLQYSDSESVLQQIVNCDENKLLSSESSKRINEAYEVIYKFISGNTDSDLNELKTFFMYFLRKLRSCFEMSEK